MATKQDMVIGGMLYAISTQFFDQIKKDKKISQEHQAYLQQLFVKVINQMNDRVKEDKTSKGKIITPS